VGKPLAPLVSQMPEHLLAVFDLATSQRAVPERRPRRRAISRRQIREHPCLALRPLPPKRLEAHDLSLL
jgi:hypothetical protein